MPLKTSTTGSWPPLPELYKPIRGLTIEEQISLARRSIKRAVEDQIRLGIDILVDGQVRDDIVSLFAAKLPGYEGSTLPYHVIGPIRPASEPITLDDFLYAKSLAGEQPLKAHLTGPMTMARTARVESESGYVDRNDQKLILDLAGVLGQEARALVQAGAEIIQIDEPVLVDGVDLEIAFDAMRKIIDMGEIPIPALHICGNVTKIMDQVLLKSPVQIISMEGTWLDSEQLSHIDRSYMAGSGKKIGLGCIQVADYAIEKLTRVQNFLDRMMHKLGEEHIWAVMPNCGLRPIPHEIALAKLEVMVQAARSL